VLSTAIHEPPVLVSVRPVERRFGKTTLRAGGRPNAVAQVVLAGFAGEHLLTGRRPRQLRAGVEVAIIHLYDPEVVAGLRPWETDGFAAVEEVRRPASRAPAREAAATRPDRLQNLSKISPRTGSIQGN